MLCCVLNSTLYTILLFDYQYVHTNLLSVLQETVALSEEVGDDLEQVEVIQRKFDDFQKDLKANEARLVELNTIAERLTAMGQTEAAEKIRIQIEDLNQVKY